MRVVQAVQALPFGVTSTISRIVTFDADLPKAWAGKAVTLVMVDEVDISRGALLVEVSETLPAMQNAQVDVVWIIDQPLVAGQSFDIKIAGKKIRARVDNIHYQVDINTLTQRGADSLPLNGIGLVELAFDEPMILDKDADNPITGGMIFIDRLSNVTVGMVRQPLQDVYRERAAYGEFELARTVVVRRHFSHWGACDLLGGK